MMIKLSDRLNYSYKGFTLAETLITLVVIGVVAAITVPILMNNNDDKQWNVAKQKARASIGEAFRTMTLSGEITTNKSTSAFVKEILPKYLKIAKECSNASDCGFPETIKRPDGQTTINMSTDNLNKWTSITTIYTNPVGVTLQNPTLPAGSTRTGTNATGDYNQSHFFVTLDGFHVNFFYNPRCEMSSRDRAYSVVTTVDPPVFMDYSYDSVCFNAIYDMNGMKGPNQVGKDIGFVGSFYNGIETAAVAVLPYNKDTKADNTLKDKMGAESNWKAAAAYCESLDHGDWVMPDINEISLIFLNKKFVGDSTDMAYWSSTPVPGTTTVRFLNFLNGFRGNIATSISLGKIICVRKTAMK